MTEETQDIEIEEEAGPEETTSTPATGPGHDIRVVAFASGLILIGKVLSIENGMICIILPFETMLDLNEDASNILAYEFVPYLQNLIDFDMDRAYPVYLNLNVIQSITLPSKHLLRNYLAQVRYMKIVHDEEMGRAERAIMH